MPLPALVPVLGSLLGIGASFLGNRSIARDQMRYNERMLDKQLEYDRPINQMARFQEAGLNPHLIYGQGSPGNQNKPLEHPGITPTDFSSLMQIQQLSNQTKLTNSQVQATNAKTAQTQAQTELNKLQARVLERNPALDNDTFKAILDSIRSTAELKAQQVERGALETDWFVGRASSDKIAASPGMTKMETELWLLLRKHNLLKVDEKIKNEILTSKSFQNDILEVQKKFMTDGDFTPQHIFMFLQLLLMKAL